VHLLQEAKHCSSTIRPELYESQAPVCRPHGGVLANYWRCLPRDSLHSRHVKTIVNTAHAIGPVE